MSRRRIYQPSPAEIWAACRAIQKTWTERERRSRSAGMSDGLWYPPGVWQLLRVGVNDRRQFGD